MKRFATSPIQHANTFDWEIIINGGLWSFRTDCFVSRVCPNAYTVASVPLLSRHCTPLKFIPKDVSLFSFTETHSPTKSRHIAMKTFFMSIIYAPMAQRCDVTKNKFRHTKKWSQLSLLHLLRASTPWKYWTSDSNSTLTVYHRDMTIQVKESVLSPPFRISLLKLSSFSRKNDAKTLL